MARKELYINLVPLNSQSVSKTPFKDVTNSPNSRLFPSKFRNITKKEHQDLNLGEDLFEKVFHMKPLKTYSPSRPSGDQESFKDERVEGWVKEQAVRVAEDQENAHHNLEDNEMQNLKRTRHKRKPLEVCIIYLLL